MHARLTCPRCFRTQVACIGSFITPTQTACEVLIQQHPLEVNHAKNSATLLQLSLPGSRLVVEEAFDGFVSWQQEWVSTGPKGGGVWMRSRIWTKNSQFR